MCATATFYMVRRTLCVSVTFSFLHTLAHLSIVGINGFVRRLFTLFIPFSLGLFLSSYLPSPPPALLFISFVSLQKGFLKRICVYVLYIPVQRIALQSPFSLQDFVLLLKMLSAAWSRPKNRITIQSLLPSPLKCHLRFADVCVYFF